MIFYLCGKEVLCQDSGRITEIKPGTAQHAISVACYLHSKCSRLRLVRDLPSSSTPLMIDYLVAGRRFPNRSDTHKHTEMFLAPC